MGLISRVSSRTYRDSKMGNALGTAYNKMCEMFRNFYTFCGGWKGILKGVVIFTAIAATVAVLASPPILSAVGFGAAGVTAGSIAASVQGPAVAAGSWFAICQSVGAVGLSAATIWATVSGSVLAIIGILKL